MVSNADLAKEAQDARHRHVVSLYVDAFNDRNIDAIGVLITDDVTLEDWATSAAGKVAVLAVTKEIVGSDPGLHAILHGVIVDGLHVAADLTIVAGSGNRLSVVDLFQFRPPGVISSIRAFRGAERRGAAAS